MPRTRDQGTTSLEDETGESGPRPSRARFSYSPSGIRTYGRASKRGCKTRLATWLGTRTFARRSREIERRKKLLEGKI